MRSCDNDEVTSKALDPIKVGVPERLKKALGKRYKGTVLFGSHARGEETKDSDVDLLILLDGPLRLSHDLDQIVSALYPLQIETGLDFDTIPADIAEFRAGEYLFYRNVASDGIEL